MRLPKYFFSILLLLLYSTAGRASEAVPLPLKDLPDFTIPKGKILYRRYCLFCHGDNGKGDGQNAFSLPARPADLNKIVPERTDDQLFAVITGEGAKNVPSSAMPSFTLTLSKDQVSELIFFLRKMAAEEEGTLPH